MSPVFLGSAQEWSQGQVLGTLDTDEFRKLALPIRTATILRPPGWTGCKTAPINCRSWIGRLRERLRQKGDSFPSQHFDMLLEGIVNCR